jgi:hypothetical protein
VFIGHLVRFYSTSFVFLTDAFTGKVLCGGDVGRGHHPRNLVSVFRCALAPRCCGDTPPHMRTDIVLYDPLSCGVHPTQIVLGIGIPLFGSKSVPLDRSLGVRWNTSSVVVHHSHFMLSKGVPLFGKGAAQTNSGVVVLIFVLPFAVPKIGRERRVFQQQGEEQDR